MNLSQYIYTSWKNGNFSEKGYMIYSKSEDITTAESNAIKDAMQYVIPKGMNPIPTPEEIKDDFPKSFAYFVLPSGRGCIAQTTYLGKDYSGRFGNYIIYASVFNLDTLYNRPYEFFAADFIKEFMTQEELDADSPVPPLEVLELDEGFDSIIAEDDIIEFISNNEEEMTTLLEMVLTSSDAEKPFYLRDSKDNLIMWIASLQRLLPLEISKKLTFNTYVGKPEFLNSQAAKDQNIKFTCVCLNEDIVPGNHNYIDFTKGNMSDSLEISDYARDIVSSASFDFEEIDEFNRYLEEISYCEISKNIAGIYKLYSVIKSGEFVYDDNFSRLLEIGSKYLPSGDRIEIVDNILRTVKENDELLSIDELFLLWKEISDTAPGLLTDIYVYMTDNIFQYVSENSDYREVLDKFKVFDGNIREGYLEYFLSEENKEVLVNYIQNNSNMNINGFYKDFLLIFYPVPKLFSVQLVYNDILEILIDNMVSNIESSNNLFDIVFSSKLIVVSSFYEDVILFIYEKIQEFNKKEYFYKKFIEYTYKNEESFAKMKEILMSNNKTRDFIVEIEKTRINNVENPMEYFWEYYRKYSTLVAETITKDVAFVAIKRAAAGLNFKDVFKFINDVDNYILSSDKIKRILVDKLNEISLETLDTVPSILFEKLVDLDEKEEVLNLQCLNIFRKLESSEIDLENEKVQSKLKLRLLSTKEYKYYVDNCMGEFIKKVKKSSDLNIVVNCFEHATSSYFASGYVDILKTLYKKKLHNSSLIKITALYILKYKGTREHTKFYEYVVAYFRDFNAKELDSLIETMSGILKNDSAIEKLKEILNEKNSLKTKITMFFKK